MEINTTLYELDEILHSLNYAQINESYGELKGVMAEMIANKRDLIESYIPEYDETIIELETQMVFLEKNVKTFESALLYCESLVFDFLPITVGLEKMCLN
jgi:hypothetical protein